MDDKIEKIIELCGFREDPYWHEFEKIFSDVTLDDYDKILKNKDNLIVDKILKASAIKITTKDAFLRYSTLDESTFTITANDSLLLEIPIHIPEFAFYTTSHVYIGKGARLTNAQIHDITWIEPGAKIKHSIIQPGNGYTFIGSNTTVSNVKELKGTFISGGPIRKEGRSQIYMHAFASINMLIGAYSAPSIGLTVYNHPLGRDKSIVVDPQTYLPKLFPGEDRYRKLAVLLGYEAELGANVLLNSGTIIGAGSTIPSGSNVDGLVFLKDGKTKYYPAREPKKALGVHDT